MPASAANSILTKEGADALAKAFGFDPSKMNEVLPMLKRLITGLYPGLAGGAQFASSLEPQRENAITQLLGKLSPGNMQGTSQALQNNATSNYGAAAKNASLINRSSGLEDGFQAGQNAAFASAGAKQATDIDRQFNSPDFQSQALSQMLSAIQQGQQIPNLDSLLNIGGVLENHAQASDAKKAAGGGLGGTLGSVAGLATGVNWGSLFGGKK